MAANQLENRSLWSIKSPKLMNLLQTNEHPRSKETNTHILQLVWSGMAVDQS